MKRFIRSLIAAPLLALAASAGHAVTLGVADAQGDFLASYSGTQAGDLDVLFAYSIFDQASSTFTFGATLNGPVGATAGVRYIWGVDRGAGTERLTGGTPSVGAGIKFDAVIALNNNGTGSVNLFSGPAVDLPIGAVSVVNNSITVTVAASALPSTGFAFAGYQWNLWPRAAAVVPSNADISDFAPNSSSLGVLAITPVPEPDALAMMLAGLGLVGFIARRRSKAA
jgi:hypothetical protein